MPRIHVVVSEEQKARWENFAEEEGSMDSVSDLIRTSVEGYIATDDEGEELNTEVIDEISASLDEFEGKLGDIETEIKALRQENIDEDELETMIRHIFGIKELISLQEMEDKIYEISSTLPEDRDRR